MTTETKKLKQKAKDIPFLDASSGATEIDDCYQTMSDNRFKWERRWHENNFFDDGFHYRYISNDTQQIIDYADQASIYEPKRAIPKTSRQIRGVINLLLVNRPTPVVYPKSMYEDNYSTYETYIAKRQAEEKFARNQGIWLEDTWKQQQLVGVHLPYALLLAAKHGVSYIHAYPNTKTQEVNYCVNDAFDWVVPGEITELKDAPLIIKAAPQYMSWIRANEKFAYGDKVMPDNQLAASKIKQNYLNSTFGNMTRPKSMDTAIVKEAYVPTKIDNDVWKEINKQKDADVFKKRFQTGDIVIKQIWVCGMYIQYTRYLPISQYPVVDMRFEPGPMYQTPFMDRFKSSNKVLDNIVSKVEKNVQTLAAGKYWRRSGEDWELTNDSYGQIIESNTKPEPLDVGVMPNFVFNLIQMVTSYIEEQGVSTTALGKLPAGVKSGVAIESLKESEYSNLTVPLEQLKGSVWRLGNLTVDLGSVYVKDRQRISTMENGKEQSFDFIGEYAAGELKGSKRGDIVGATVLSPSRRLEIDIESQLGLTAAGKRQAAREIADYMAQLAQGGVIPPEALKEVVSQLLKTYKFGATNEIMQAIDKYIGQQGEQGQNDRINETKIAVAEVMRDMGMGQQQQQDQQVMTSKLGAAEAIKDINNAVSTQPTPNGSQA